MKHINYSVLFLSCLLTFSQMVFAQQISEVEAMNKAVSFFANHSNKESGIKKAPSNGSNQVTLAYTAGNDKTNFFYVYNRGENDGYVIVGGDEQAKEILAYVPQGHFVYDSLPENLKWWIGQYAHAIDSVTTYSLATKKRAKTQVSNILDSFQEVPCMITTHWAQSEPFNNAIPQIGDVTPPTGCAATAVAQIMKYWNYPASGVGSNSYTYNGNTYSADFEHTTYDWENMLDSYVEGQYTSQQANAVATLMYHVGVALNMNYQEYSSNIPSSSAIGCNYNLSDIRRGLVQHMKYKNTAMRIERPDYTDDEWFQIMYDELSAGRPFIYEGFGNAGGHVFVCHGYSASLKMFAFNWGWGGQDDGYFEVDPINGINGFKPEAMVVGIRPNEGPGSMPVSFGERFEAEGLYYHVISPNKKTVALAYHPDGYEQTSITIPSSVNYKGEIFQVTHIGPGAFHYLVIYPEGGYGIGCAWNMKNLVIPDGVIVIENKGLEGAPNLSNVVLPKTLKRIGAHGFWYLKELRHLELPYGLEFVSPTATFQGAGIDSLVIPGSLKEVQGFGSCDNLKHVVIEEGSEIICGGGFNDCSSLNTIVLPSTMNQINVGVFYGCDSLTSCYCYAPDLLASHRDETGSWMSITTCDWLGNCTTEYVQVWFSDSVNKGTLYVPAESITMYDTAYTWRQWGQVLPIQLPTSLTLSQHEIHINEGDSIRLSSTVLPQSEAFGLCRWTSSNSEYATVNSSGLVSGLKVGQVVIKAILNVGAYLEDSCVVTISKTPTDIENIGIDSEYNDNSQPKKAHKILRNGQIFILRGRKTYTITGQEIR